EAARLFFKLARVKPFHFSAQMRENIPRCRGLGSSATVRVGVLHALNELSGRPLDRLSIFQLAAELERHPDNAAPASFGGFTVTRGESVQRFDVSARLSFVLLVPDYEVSTPASREYEQLRGAFVDRLHQPFRTKLNPLLPRVAAAAEKARSLGAFLSGSGSTICAMTLQDRHRVAGAMQAAANKSARVIITTADNHGVKIHGA